MQLDLIDEALQEFLQLLQTDRKAAEKLLRLLMEMRETPFTGTGKPEPLKHEFKGHWSRRITKEHRVVYRVEKDVVVVVSCFSHYGDR